MIPASHITDESLARLENQTGRRYVRFMTPSGIEYALGVTHIIEPAAEPVADDYERPAYACVTWSLPWNTGQLGLRIVELRVYSASGELLLRSEDRDIVGSHSARYDMLKNILRHLHACGRVRRVRLGRA